MEALIPEGMVGPLWTAAVLVTLCATWVAMWQLFLRHIPVLANLKAVILGEKQLPPRAKRREVVFRGPQRKETPRAGSNRLP